MNLSNYEKRVRSATPAKAVRFLRTAATRVEIRRLLFGAGYTEQEQILGWRLLGKAGGNAKELPPEVSDQQTKAAIEALDAWDEGGFRRIDAALRRFFPAQRDFVFNGLSAGRGAEAVLSVATLLDRLDALDGSPERTGSKKADRAALAKLAERGINAEERTRLRELVVTAQSATKPDTERVLPAAERAAALEELLAWYRDWAETARAVITRKEYLIMLGLSRRKTSPSGEEVEEVEETELPEAEDPVEPTPATA